VAVEDSVDTDCCMWEVIVTSLLFCAVSCFQTPMLVSSLYEMHVVDCLCVCVFVGDGDFSLPLTQIVAS